ncbi:MAG: FxsA family protein [Rhodobacteraceae bacterium]|nr:FxsA family protein [Paracoccaceae bacterium]
MILFFLFVIIPIIEIALLINIGGSLGTPTTLAIILITALIGSISLRRQGAVVWRRLSQLEVITLPDLLSHGLLLMLASVFLITPGFLTDACGLLLLIPPVRNAIARYLLRHASANFHQSPAGSGPGPTIQPKPDQGSSADTESDTSSQSQQTTNSPWADARSKQPKRRSAEDATILDKDRESP